MTIVREVREIHCTPAIVVGSGVAGLSAALGLERCVVVTRGELGTGSSRCAQGGIAAALSTQDSTADHAADTLAVSAGLAAANVARTVTAAAPERIAWLTGLGACFDRDRQGNLSLGREAGHRARRIVHAEGDKTGAEVMRVLIAAVHAHPAIELREGYELVDLLSTGARVAGVLAYSPDKVLTAFVSPAVVLATGGIGGLYTHTTNPPEVAGDGLAVAIRASARLADLEFVQFHPTALACAMDPMPLLSEALRGEGAVLTDELGERFMPSVHQDAELAPRDVVARAIWQHQRAGHRTLLDARSAIGQAFPQRFPGIWQIAQSAGYDPRSEPLPVTPAEHYFMGGIATGLAGRTSLAGLWAVGEVASTGLHGANRLASNSLLEGLVLGQAAARDIKTVEAVMPALDQLQAPADMPPPPGTRTNDIVRAVRALMWDKAGLTRNAHGLQAAIGELNRMLQDPAALTLTARNRLMVARAIVTAALAREESRGAHYRSDFPQPDAHQRYRRTVAPPRVAQTPLGLAAERVV